MYFKILKSIIKLLLPPIFTIIIKYFLSLFNKIKYSNLPFNNVEIIVKNKYYDLQYEYDAHNTWYQHGLSVKTYAGFNMKYKLPVRIEHGVYYFDIVNNNFINYDLAGMFVSSEFRKEIIMKYSKLEVTAIGPYIHYAKSLLKNFQFMKVKKKLGKTLLLMPSHSNVYTTPVRTNNDLFDTVKKICNDFDTIRACFHWHDIENNLHLPYKNLGWDCVCAGHERSHLFLSRLRSIFELSDFIVIEGMTTGIGYAIYLGKPLLLIDPKAEYNITSLGIKDNNSNELYKKYDNNPASEEAFKVFSNYSDKITNDQLQFVDKYNGLYSIKTKEEMRDLILYYESKLNKDKWKNN